MQRTVLLGAMFVLLVLAPTAQAELNFSLATEGYFWTNDGFAGTYTSPQITWGVDTPLGKLGGFHFVNLGDVPLFNFNVLTLKPRDPDFPFAVGLTGGYHEKVGGDFVQMAVVTNINQLPALAKYSRGIFQALLVRKTLGFGGQFPGEVCPIWKTKKLNLGWFALQSKGFYRIRLADGKPNYGEPQIVLIPGNQNRFRVLCEMLVLGEELTFKYGFEVDLLRIKRP